MMNYSIFSTLFLLTIKTLALPSAFGDEHSIEPINKLDALLTSMTYIGPIDSSGETHRINGTAEVSGSFPGALILPDNNVGK